ncbi:hypothetical protein [Bradyrhizobium sp.]|uniref:hypothetical protein n=1 Tax=Bradyrhizobium sp. TaxID=376 RepID=UPI0027316D8E|nr:hypothetical protein [Bradyrhizobium sp.]MDP1867848.1 hypothetical protein [Bradyrhizobium sp.]MDP3074047.1 hypothetical protein [Bradyrhizobium sp.]
MPSSARIFVAGVLTTFVILALGFGGDLVLAQLASKEPSGYQTRASSVQPPAVRVILPASAEPAQQARAASAVPAPQPQIQPVKEVQAPIEKQIQNAHAPRTSVAAEERRERRKRYAEQKSRRMDARAKQQMEQTRQRSEAGILAFGGDDLRSSNFWN